MTTVSEAYGTVDAFLDSRIATITERFGPSTVQTNEYRAQWLASMTRVADEVLAMELGRAVLTMDHAVLVDFIPDDVDEWECPLALKTSDFVEIAGHVRNFWIYGVETEPAKWDALIALSVERIDALTLMVDAPGPVQIVQSLTIEQFSTMPTSFLNEMGNAYGCQGDWESLGQAIAMVIAEVEGSVLPADGEAMIAQVKQITGIDTLVDP